MKSLGKKYVLVDDKADDLNQKPEAETENRTTEVKKEPKVKVAKIQKSRLSLVINELKSDSSVPEKLGEVGSDEQESNYEKKPPAKPGQAIVQASPSRKRLAVAPPTPEQSNVKTSSKKRKTENTASPQPKKKKLVSKVESLEEAPDIGNTVERATAGEDESLEYAHQPAYFDEID
jgi:hypothetical protein